MPRFHLPETYDSPQVELSGSEAHHLRRVLRMRPGNEATLFDGRGTEARAEIVAVGRERVELRILSVRTDEPPRPVLWLAAAVPKGDRFRVLVEKATELGVDRLVPLRTRYGVVEPGAAKLSKLRQTVIAACKQSGRNRLMEIDSPQDWGDFLDAFAGPESAGSEIGIPGSQRSPSAAAPSAAGPLPHSPPRLWVAHPSGEPAGAMLAEAASLASVAFAVGPEGGFTADELDQACSAGAGLVSLGPRILRVETAGLALAAAVRLTATGP